METRRHLARDDVEDVDAAAERAAVVGLRVHVGQP
jgi:hypothetical protein